MTSNLGIIMTVKFIISAFFCLFLASCAVQKPEFVKVDSIELYSFSKDTISLKGGVVFKNPNLVGGKVHLDKITTQVNGIDLGYLESNMIKVPAKKEFIAPFTVKVAYDKIFSGKGGLLGTLYTTFVKKEVEVKLEGTAQFKRWFIKREYPIKYHKTIKID